jgi:hypothetical protein
MIIYLALIPLLSIILLLLLPAQIFRALRSWSQTLNWEACLILASLLAFSRSTTGHSLHVIRVARTLDSDL